MEEQIIKLARWYYERMVGGERRDGSKFYKFEADNKEDDARCYALAMAAHDDGDIMPDDWRYRFIRECLSQIGDGSLDPTAVEADIYTDDLTGWLHSRVSRYVYCDQAVEEELVNPVDSIMKRIAVGQMLEKQEVMRSLLRKLAEEAGQSEAWKAAER